MEFGLFSLFDFFRDKQDEVRYFQDTLDICVQAEELGFDSIWLGEEHFYAFGICPSPQMFLTAVARETSRIRLGTAISLLPFENPLRKAEDFAMLDILSNGRLNFGAGRGIVPSILRDFVSIRPRVGPAMKRPWRLSDGPGLRTPLSIRAALQVPSLSVGPKPVQRPHPPIYRGTLSRESFDGAGKVGDNAFIAPWLSAPHPEVVSRLQHYRATLQEHGHGPTRTTCIFFLFVNNDHQEAVRDARETTPPILD